MGDAGDGLGGRPGLGQMSEGPRTVWAVLGAASMALGAYHGYRRHRGSIGWAIGWALTGAFFPVITPAIAYAQGFGKPMRRNPRRR